MHTRLGIVMQINPDGKQISVRVPIDHPSRETEIVTAFRLLQLIAITNDIQSSSNICYVHDWSIAANFPSYTRNL